MILREFSSIVLLCVRSIIIIIIIIITWDIVVSGTATTSCDGVTSGMDGVLDPASAGRHQATDQTKERMKWEKAVNKIVNACWIRREPTKRKYRQSIYLLFIYFHSNKIEIRFLQVTYLWTIYTS